MAEVAQAESNLLTRKVGPLPVWAYALIGLVVAWIYMKYRDSKTAASTASTASTTGANSSESTGTAPEFIIENNMPADNITVTTPGSGTPSTPVTTPAAPGVPVLTPPNTRPFPPVSSKPPPVSTPIKGKPVTKPVSGKKPPIEYRVHPGDTLSSIAAKHHTSWQALWTYNTTAGNRPPETIATLKKRGPNLLYANELILIPQ